MRRRCICVAERAQGFFALGDDQQTRRVAIQTMHEAGTQRFAGEVAGVREQCVDQRAVRRAVGRMRDHSGGLVDDQEVVVFVEYVECDRLGPCLERFGGGNFELEHVAGLEGPAGLCRAAVYRDAAAAGAARDERSRGAAKRRDQDVGALSGLLSGDDV